MPLASILYLDIKAIFLLDSLENSFLLLSIVTGLLITLTLLFCHAQLNILRDSTVEDL